MSDPTEAPADALLAAMRRTHLSILVLLAACGVAIVLHGFPDQEPPPDRLVTTFAVGLGLATVLLRRMAGSPVLQPKTALFSLLGALLAAGALGLLGTWATWSLDTPVTGLMFTLAGTIFAVRPPSMTLRN